MDESWRDRCSCYDSETQECWGAKSRGWLYNRGRRGVGCPFGGSISGCNEYSYSHPTHFENDQEVVAYVKYGIEPGQNIPIDELCLEGLTLQGVILNGVRIYRFGQDPKVIREDGKEHDVWEKD